MNYSLGSIEVGSRDTIFSAQRKYEFKRPRVPGPITSGCLAGRASKADGKVAWLGLWANGTTNPERSICNVVVATKRILYASTLFVRADRKHSLIHPFHFTRPLGLWPCAVNHDAVARALCIIGSHQGKALASKYISPAFGAPTSSRLVVCLSVS